MGRIEKVKGACPLDCYDTCSWIVTVQDGKAVNLMGNAEHPFTKGVLCAKMNRYLDYTQSPDRLLHPLRRIGRKGEGRFERTSWDYALTEIAERFQKVIDEYGGEAIWPYCGTGHMGMIQGAAGGGRRLWNAIGASRHLRTICTVAGGVGTGYTIGANRVGMDPETISHSRLILLWGANTLTTNHHLWRYILAAKERNDAHVVVIDPVCTRTAKQADEHLAPVPGTDAALALGLMNVVLAEGAEDRDFIAEHTLGWEKFRERLLEYCPNKVAEITGLPREVIVTLGKRLAHTRPTSIRVGIGLQRHGGGGMAVRAITCIPGVTGDWKSLGGGASYDTRDFFRGNFARLWRDDLCPYVPRGLNMAKIGDTLLNTTDPPVMGLFVYGANPVASAPNQSNVRKGLARDDLFTVVSDYFHTDTTRYADIVLPSTMQTEHADLHMAYGHIYISWNEPAVRPPEECLSNSEVFRRLAARMGLNEPCLYASDEELAEDVLRSDDSALRDVTLARLKAEGWVRLNYPEPFVPFQEGFLTPSKRLEFFSERMQADGLDPLPGFVEPYESFQQRSDLPQRYPLVLIAGASHYFLNSMFGNIPKQVNLQGPLRVLVHPEDAALRNLRDDDPVRVFNDRGSFPAVITISGDVRHGVVATTKGYWPMYRNGSPNVNVTTAERDSDMGGGAVFHDNRVELEKFPIAA